MITIVYGPGGSGKSYYQMRLIHEEMKNGRRNVSTSLAVELPAYQAYCDKMGLKVDVASRIRILTPAEGREFWKYRGPNRWNPHSEYDLLVDPGTEGTLFVLDEAGVLGFDSKGWAAKHGNTSRGEACSWYLDQQRKFGDDVIASVNGSHPHGIAKPLRDKAHNFVKLRNGYQRQMGIFKARGRFEAQWFAMEPTPTSEAWRKETWELDTTGLAGCYRTQDGVGITGTTADIGKRAKGIPVLWAFPLAIAAASSLFIVPWALAKLAKRGGAKASQSLNHAMTGKEDGSTERESSPVSEYAEVSGVYWDERGKITVGLPGIGWFRAVAQDGERMILDGGYVVRVRDVLRGQSPAVAETSVVRSGAGVMGYLSQTLNDTRKGVDRRVGTPTSRGNSSSQRQGATAPR